MILLTGIDTKAKNEFILGKIHESYFTKKRQVQVIVPEQFTLTMERMLIEDFKLQGLLGLEVTSLSRLINKVSTDLISHDKVALNSLGRKLLIKKIVSDHLEKLKVYYKSYNKLGLVNEIENVISSFKNEKIAVEDIEELRSKLNESDLLSQKLEDIILIYDEYNHVVEEAYTDEARKFELFMTYIDLIHEIKDSDVYIYGFNGFSNQELEVVKAIDIQSNSTTIILNYDERYSKNVFAFTEKTRLQIYDYFPDLSENKFEEALNQSIEFALGMNQYHTMKADISLEIFTGKNIYSECQYVASKINQLILKDKMNINDIGIMLVESESYSSIITRELRRYNLPYFADEKRSLKNTNIIRALMSLLSFYESNFKTVLIMQYLKSIIRIEDWDEVDSLENYALAHGIDRNRWKNKIEDEFYEKLRIKYVDHLIKWQKKLSKKQTVESFSNLVIELLGSLKMKESIDHEIESLKEHQMEDEILLLAQVWNKFIDIIDQIREASGDEPISLKEYIEYLKFSFEDEKVGLIPTISEGIQINVLGRSVLTDLKVVFVMGLNEENLPREMSESNVLSETDKEKFKQNGLNLKDDIIFYKTKEILDFFAILSKIEEKTIFTLSSSNKGGRAIKPSYYIGRAKQLVENYIEKDDIIDDHQITDNWLYHFEILRLNVLKQLRAMREGHKISDEWVMIIAAFKDKYEAEYEKLIANIFYENQSSPIKKVDSDSNIFTSTTRLERYAKCPYAYFAQYDLKLRERREYKVSFPEIGNLYHEIMQMVVDDIMNGIIIPKDSTNYIDQKVDELMSKKEYRVFSNRYETQYLVKKAKNLMRKIINNILGFYNESEYKPHFTEVDFTHELGKGQFDPVVVDLDDERKVVIQGKIDRIDLYKKETGETYCNIVDYKTGSKNLRLDEMVKGLEYQLAVYILASLINQETLSVKQIIPSGVLYYRIHDDYMEFTEKSKEDIEIHETNKFKMTGLVLDDVEILEKMDATVIKDGTAKYIPVKMKKDGTLSSNVLALGQDGFDYLLELTQENIRNIGLKILEGEISILPIKEKQFYACQFCKFQNVCKFEINFYSNDYRYIDIETNKEAIMKINEAIGSEDRG